MPKSVKQGLTRAAAVGMPLLRAPFTSGEWATTVNGWRYPPPQVGRFGDSFLARAADQCLAGIASNEPAEAVYLLNFGDADGGLTLHLRPRSPERTASPTGCPPRHRTLGS